jgi:hypothetical protein
MAGGRVAQIARFDATHPQTEATLGGVPVPDLRRAGPGRCVRSHPGATERPGRASIAVVTKLPIPGLFQPTGIAVAADGAIYVSNNGDSAANAAKPGEVLKITGA